MVADKIEIATNYTPSLVLAEICGWFAYHKRAGVDKLIEFIKTKSSIIELISEKIAVRGGEIQGIDKRRKKDKGSKEKPVSYIDAILMAFAESMKIRVITGDKHFKEFPMAEYIS